MDVVGVVLLTMGMSLIADATGQVNREPVQPGRRSPPLPLVCSGWRCSSGMRGTVRRPPSG